MLDAPHDLVYCRWFARYSLGRLRSDHDLLRAYGELLPGGFNWNLHRASQLLQLLGLLEGIAANSGLLSTDDFEDVRALYRARASRVRGWLRTHFIEKG